MATTATCTRFTDEYQLYEELGKYGARCAPRRPPGPGAASRLQEDEEEEEEGDEPPSSAPAPRAPRLQGKVSPQPAPAARSCCSPGLPLFPLALPGPGCPLLLPLLPLPSAARCPSLRPGRGTWLPLRDASVPTSSSL